MKASSASARRTTCAGGADAPRGRASEPSDCTDMATPWRRAESRTTLGPNARLRGAFRGMRTILRMRDVVLILFLTRPHEFAIIQAMSRDAATGVTSAKQPFGGSPRCGYSDLDPSGPFGRWAGRTGDFHHEDYAYRSGARRCRRLGRAGRRLNRVRPHRLQCVR